MGPRWKWKSLGNLDNISPNLCITSEGNEESKDQRPKAKNVKASKKSRVLSVEDEKGISILSAAASRQPRQE